jgi:23S rRNA pseudouridine1911/1915/1917 synthase
MEILYEDNHIIAVNKKCGEIIQGDITGDPTLGDKVKQYLKEKYNKPGNVYLGLPHRLDRPTSGVVLFAKTSKVLPRLNNMFKEKDTIRKIYWAVVDKRPPKDSDTLVHYLVKNEEQNKSTAHEKPVPNSKSASLSYRYIAHSDRYFLLEIDLHTGRHHQIRAQLAKTGCLIKGDLKYGFPRSNPNAGIHLHARKISFLHPVKNIQIEIIADPPDDPIWNVLMNSISDVQV